MINSFFDFPALQDELNKNLFGQHIVLEILPPILSMHLSDDNPKKPLVISFHGPTGTGKNHVVNMITNRLYKKGMDSKFVHKFYGRLKFPEANLSKEYGVRF
jgi:torsin-1